jgi:hypothetical protein
MWPVTRRIDRRYRCTECGRAVDALSAEVTVWEKARLARPSLGTGATPYDQRQVLLAREVLRVDLTAGGGFRLWWAVG